MRYLLYAGLFVGGLALVGSDGLWFPIPNIVGLGMVVVLAILLDAEAKTRWTKRTK